MNMSIIVPNLDWYKEKSLENNLPNPRCPFAAVKSCPRYYQSLSLLGDAGATKIDPSEDEKLLKFWKTDDLWPKTREQATSVVGSNIFSNFCPEVTFEEFGHFASYLSRYSDEIEIDFARRKINDSPKVENDWRYKWRRLTPQHYSDCSLYSVLYHRSNKSQDGIRDKEIWYKRLWEIILAIICRVIGG